MRLITHNMLQCPVKGCSKDNFPLRIEDAEIENADADFNPQFLKRMLDRIAWGALVQTSFSLGVAKLPESPGDPNDDEFLQTLHHVLLETRVKEGRMVCNGCGHVYPIREGIPNMLLQENEV
ncbi:Trm112p-domain-containing protein [Gonapodya prolifera JEL478]|uniref:Trm112p-domain-containing protein n=1 Tax=Gonapodya prolifera (strain JEL478) TaxID=1344416 RepID=A0A139AY01_GONPJ|nr:Trm112p-domain-containing protein [Gonapodya prolifera JEL478]|eukprot:KXS21618.1 Trm112p-domain-containing protein [Gonapodya prolifera JEL478]